MKPADAMDNQNNKGTARPRIGHRAVIARQPVNAADLAMRFAAFFLLTILTSFVFAIPYLAMTD